MVIAVIATTVEREREHGNLHRRRDRGRGRGASSAARSKTHVQKRTNEQRTAAAATSDCARGCRAARVVRAARNATQVMRMFAMSASGSSRVESPLERVRVLIPLARRKRKRCTRPRLVKRAAERASC